MSKVTEACGLGTAIHAAFDRATKCEEAGYIHKLITDMPNKEWNAILEYIVDEMPEGVQTAMEHEVR